MKSLALLAASLLLTGCVHTRTIVTVYAEHDRRIEVADHAPADLRTRAEVRWEVQKP